jgi:hypothetical protein
MVSDFNQLTDVRTINPVWPVAITDFGRRFWVRKKCFGATWCNQVQRLL